jgi:hypothetical protein
MNNLEMKLKTIPFTIVPRRIKYLVINIAKGAHDLYTEKYGTLLKEIKEDLNKWKALYVLRGWEDFTLFSWQYSSGDVHMQCNPNPSPSYLFCRT